MTKLDKLVKIVKGGPGSGRHLEEDCEDTSMHRHARYGENEESGFCHPYAQTHSDPVSLRAHIKELRLRIKENPGNVKVKAALVEAEKFQRGVPKDIEKDLKLIELAKILKKGGPGSGKRAQEMCPRPEDHKHWGFDFCHSIERLHRDKATKQAHLKELQTKITTQPQLYDKIKEKLEAEGIKAPPKGEAPPKEAPPQKEPVEREIARRKEAIESRRAAGKEARELRREEAIDEEARKIMGRDRMVAGAERELRQKLGRELTKPEKVEARRMAYQDAREIAEKFPPKIEEEEPKFTEEERRLAELEEDNIVIISERFPGYHISRPAPWHVKYGVAEAEGIVHTPELGFDLPRTIFASGPGTDLQAEMQIIESPDGSFHVGEVGKKTWGVFARRDKARAFIESVFEHRTLPKDTQDAIRLANKWLDKPDHMISPEVQIKEHRGRMDKEHEERIKEWEGRSDEEREKIQTEYTKEAEDEREGREKEAWLQHEKVIRRVAGKEVTRLKDDAEELKEMYQRAIDADASDEDIAKIEERQKKNEEAMETTQNLADRLDDESEDRRKKAARAFMAQLSARKKAEEDKWKKRLGETEEKAVKKSDIELPEYGEDFIYNAAILLKHVMGEGVLELGSGTGRLLKVLNKGAHKPVGIDVSKDDVTSSAEEGLESYQYDLEKGVPFNDETFDSVISMHCLEHLENAQAVAEDSFRIAIKGAAHLIPLEKKEMFEGWEVEEIPGTKCAVIFKVKKMLLEEAKEIGDKLSVDWDKIDIKEFRRGLLEEQEHAETVHGDEDIIARIALDHLEEDPKYYTKLKEVEKEVARKQIGEPKTETERRVARYDISEEEAERNPDRYPLPERGKKLEEQQHAV